jgi:protein-tyrosine phosphatase
VPRGVGYVTVGSWNPTAPGVLRLPSGRLMRGRALSRGLPAGPLPDFAVYLLDERPVDVDWDASWVRWPDFRLPRHPGDAWDTLFEAWRRAEAERVEIACKGGRGRTGTALACIAALDGVPAREAVAFVRRHYDRHAVETPWQRRYVTHFPLERPIERVHGTPADILRALLAAVRGHR